MMAEHPNVSIVKREQEESDSESPTMNGLKQQLDKAQNTTERLMVIARQYLSRKDEIQKRVEFLESLIDRKNVDGPKERERLEKIIQDHKAELAQCKDGPQLQHATEEEEKIHFKLTHDGITRRFSLSRREGDLLNELKERVKGITGMEDLPLFWIDEEHSRVVLESDECLNEAIDSARKMKKETVCLETGGKKKKVTEEESRNAYDGCIVWCDKCECVIGPSIGGRFKCLECKDYDLCRECLGKTTHPNHAFIRIMDSNTVIPHSNGVGEAVNKKLSNEKKRALRELQNAEDVTGDEENSNDDDNEDYTPAPSRKASCSTGFLARRNSAVAMKKEKKRKSAKGDEATASKTPRKHVINRSW